MDPAGALEIIADAIAATPRSPFLDDLAMARTAKTIVEAQRLLRELSGEPRDAAQSLVAKASQATADAIRRRDYECAYRLLDELPDRLQILKPN
jgi:hypothetical protein